MHGARGEDPTEPPASAPYPYPAVSHEPRIQQLSDDLEAAGYHPFHAPCGIRLNESNMPYSACVRCTNCDGFPALVHAKSDAEVLGVRPALEHPNVTLLTNAQGGQARDRTTPARPSPGWSSSATARRRAYRGDIVVVACGAANSPSCCSPSANDRHPNGLANGSDQVGRNYMFHNSAAVLALSREENPTIFQKTLGLNDFYFGSRRLRLPDGQHPDGRQVAGADVPRREAAARRSSRRSWSLDDVAEARRRLLALDRGPAPCRRTASRSTATASITLSYTATNDKPKKQLYKQAASRCSAIWACSRTTSSTGSRT